MKEYDNCGAAILSHVRPISRYCARKDYQKALLDYGKAIELLPGNAQLYGERGGASAEKGHYDAAISEFDKAAELDPAYARAVFLRGSTYLLKGKSLQEKNAATAASCYRKAADDFTRTLELDPKNADARQNRELADRALRAQ